MHLEKKSFIHFTADFVLLATLHSAKIRPGKENTDHYSSRVKIKTCMLELSVKQEIIQHQNPKFGHTQAEIHKKNTAKSTLAFNGG